MPETHLRLFGSPVIERGGASLAGRVAQRHRLALLALLALAPNRRASRDKLVALLWPDADPDRARNLLNVSTYTLRTALGEQALVTVGDDLQLGTDVVHVDVIDFESRIHRQEFEEAATLYRGPLLDGFFLSEAPEFERWLEEERQRLASEYRKALEVLAIAARDRNAYQAAVEWWKRRAAQDPYDSRVALEFMQALDASGNPAGALQHAALHQRRLHEEFGLAEAPEIAAAAERIRHQPATRAPQPTSAVGELPASATTRPAADHGADHATGRTGPRRWRKGLPNGAAVVLITVVLGVAWLMWGGAEPSDRSIVVLPFVNFSTSEDNQYFADGLTEEIIARLASIEDLKVISRTSSMYFKGSQKPLREIATELGVTHVLEGSVRWSEGRVLITAQLIDAARDEHRWAQSYEHELDDLLRVQQSIALAVARALELELGEQGGRLVTRQGTRDPVAYDYYRRARYLWGTRTKEAHEQAIEYYRRAIELDSGFAEAYAGIADVYLTAQQLNLGLVPESETYTRIMAAAERALALDSESADARASFAIALWWHRNWRGAERELQRAIALNPNHATARMWYSLLLAGMGRLTEAREQGRQAFELDPFAVIPNMVYTWQCYLSREHECALEQSTRTKEIFPTWPPAHSLRGMIFTQVGMLDSARRSFERAIALRPHHTDYLAELAYAQALLGDTAAARQNIAEAKAKSFEPFMVARAYVALGHHDSAYAWLEKSSWQWPHRAVLSDPALDPLRAEARFGVLARRVEEQMGLRQAEQ